VHLLRLLPRYASSPLIRTRDAARLAACAAVVDVGGEYDHAARRYDHHQRGFAATFPGRATKLSAAGLVYLNHGRAALAVLDGRAIAGDGESAGEAGDDADIVLAHEKLYEDLIEAFDANDNGIDAFDASALTAANLAPKFSGGGFSLAAAVRRLNSAGLPADAAAEEALSPEQRQANEDARFWRASALVGEQFELAARDVLRAWLPARAVVRALFAELPARGPASRILVLPHRAGGLPWADHLYTCEAEDPAREKVLYVLFPESGDAKSRWRVRSVGVERGSFRNRKDLPEAWKGLRDEELSRLSGVPGCVFVHASGFIGGNLTLEGAMAMATKAVETPGKEEV
jgi:uncharacterized UPF0160 family protein